MKPEGNGTHTDEFATPEYSRRFRDQATGVGQTRKASEQTGARRSQCVIDEAPKSQLKCADPSYPAPSPMWRDGQCYDRMTGRILSPVTLTRAG